MSNDGSKTPEQLGINFSSPPGPLKDLFDAIDTPCAVVIPANVSTVTISGHLGFDAQGQFPKDLGEEIENAFKNVEQSLKHAGAAKGWKAVYSVQTFQSVSRVPSGDEFFTAFMPIKERYTAGTAPIWTAMSVPELYGGAAIEVVVHAAIEPLQAKI